MFGATELVFGATELVSGPRNGVFGATELLRTDQPTKNGKGVVIKTRFIGYRSTKKGFVGVKHSGDKCLEKALNLHSECFTLTRV
mgnify:CR=1 FL=1